jgi:hypothetical protein
VLPLGFGWSLWIHLFVQYPKTLTAIVLALLLSTIPVDKTGLGTSEHSVGREVVCTVIADTGAGGCPSDSIETTRQTPPPRGPGARY